MAQKLKKSETLQIPLNFQLDRGYDHKNPQQKRPSQLNSSNPDSYHKDRGNSTHSAKLALTKAKAWTKGTQSNNKRRESFQVFDRLNISPCHKERLGCRHSILLNSFQDSMNKQKPEKTSPIQLKTLEKCEKEMSQEDLLQNLLEILNKLDQEKPPVDLDDYKDYLIFRLCKKLKEYMKMGQFQEKKTDGELTGRNQNNNNHNITRDVMNIHSKIERSLSNIENQLEKEIGNIKVQENTSIQEVHESDEEKRAKVIEKLKKLQDEEENKKELDEKINGNRRCDQYENDDKVTESQDFYKESMKECQVPASLKDNKVEMNNNPLQDPQPDEIPQEKLNHNACDEIFERGTQTEYLFERHENNIKYPTELLMSSLEKVKKHQLFYEKFEQENEALLKAESSGFNFTRRDKSPPSPEDNPNRTIRSPFQDQNNNDFIEEVSICMKTNKKEDILGKIRNYGYLEKIESRYIEIVELFNEKCPGVNINSHFELISALTNLIRENTELQNIYLDFKRQVLDILIPDLPIFETRSAGEILEIISQLAGKNNGQHENEEFMKSGAILNRIFDELGVFLESDDALMRLLAGMTKDLNDLQYQCKLIAGMLDIETSSDMKEILDITMTIISKKQDFRF